MYIKKTLLALLILSLSVVSRGQENRRKAVVVTNPNPPEFYQPRLKASDSATWNPVKPKVNIPVKGVVLAKSSIFRKAMERNIDYLLNSFSVNHLLYPFRLRFGVKNPPDDRKQVGFWDTDLRGSNAGRFMMGAGNTLRWQEHRELRSRLNELIDGIEACREPDGYILAYPHVIDSLRSEEPNYARAWFTHGLLESAIAGNDKAYGLLRGHADWFNRWDELHPRLLHWNNNSHQGHIASTRTYLSPVGKAEDLQLAEKYYVCDWWLDALAGHDKTAVWQYPLQNPHSYLITSFEAYLDHYFATGDPSFLKATTEAWNMIHDEWEHVGGSVAICEKQWFVVDSVRRLGDWGEGHPAGSYPPHSYYLTSDGHTGETCGSVFWIKFNQRFHRLFPEQEKYVNEIEKSLYNVNLANQTSEGGIRYHAGMEGKKENATLKGYNTCCEGQGTRLLGSLPEYIYSTDSEGVYVNLFEPSSIDYRINGHDINLTLDGDFPFKPEISLKIKTDAPVKMKLRIRIPSWATQTTTLYINGKKAATGAPGTYVTLARRWNSGDLLTFTLPMALRTTKYTGFDTIANAERYAFEYGPLLLALTGSEQVPATLSPNILYDFQNKLHRKDSLLFAVESSNLIFKPYWLIDKEKFTVFPVVHAKTDTLKVRDPFVVVDKASKTYYIHVNQCPDVGLYSSADLKTWTQIKQAFTPDSNFWGKNDCWAPDVYAYRGKYYLLVTYSSNKQKRGTAILVSDKITGPFKPLINRPITPNDQTCLDASLYIDEQQKPWLVFAHEWVEVRDGEVVAQRLSDDLTTLLGEPVLLFKASSAPWTAALPNLPGCYVTDAPVVYRAQNGDLLMIWSSFTPDGKYTIGVAKSKNGKIDGEWEHFPAPLNSDDGGHAMIFRDLNGQLKISYHATNSDSRLTIRNLNDRDGVLSIEN